MPSIEDILDIELVHSVEENDERSDFCCPHCGYDRSIEGSVIVDVRGELVRWCSVCAHETTLCEICGVRVPLRDASNEETDDGEVKVVCRRCYKRKFAITEEERIQKHIGRYSAKTLNGKIMQLYGYHEYENLIPQNKLWRTRIANDDGTPNKCFNDLLTHSAQIKELDYPLLGVELEMSGAGLSAKNAYKISCEMGFPTTICNELKFSRDGSLPDGLEVITMPGNLNYHEKVINWKNGMKKAASLGYRSHDAGICGLHIHVNRSFFNEDKDFTEDKLTTFVYNNSEWLKKFSRRTNFDYCRFVHKEHSQNDTITFSANDIKTPEGWKKTKEVFKTLEDSKYYNRDHHAAISFTPHNTIEFRLFRGTLVYTTFIAALQLVTVICKLIKNCDIKKAEQLRLRHIIQTAKKLHYNELIDYINSRNCKEFRQKAFKVLNEDFSLTEQNVEKDEPTQVEEVNEPAF